MPTAKNALVFLLACLSFAANVLAQEKLTFGRMDDSVYVNDYFRIKLSIPKSWHVQSAEFNESLKERGKEMLSDGSGLERVADISLSRTFVLLTFSKYEIGTNVSSNPTIVLVAERVDDVPEIKIGSDYLFYSKNFLLKSKLSYKIDDDFTPLFLGGKNFYMMSTQVPFAPDLILKQKYYSTITKGFALSFIASYSGADEDELAEMEEIINNIIFSPASE